MPNRDRSVRNLRRRLVVVGAGATVMFASTMTSLAQPQAEKAPSASITKKQNRPAATATSESQFSYVYPAGVSVGTIIQNSVGGGIGELQSTVVPGGKKDNCPGGRFLISNDSSKDPGYIVGFDLDGLGGAAKVASIDGLPEQNDRHIASNDHDLVTLGNGDVLLMKMGRSRKSLNSNPAWFDHTYKLGKCTKANSGLEVGLANPGGLISRGVDAVISKNPDRVFGPVQGECKSAFGPGARSVTYVWRSEDCGQTFDYLTDIDMATINDGADGISDGSAGLPQKMKDFPDGVMSPPGSASQPVWQMGGTDGSLAKVDYATGKIFYTMGVFGRRPGENPQKYELTGTLVNRTAVSMSSDKGDSWIDATSLPFTGWRTDVVPLGDNRLAFLPSGLVKCPEQLPGVDEQTKCQFIFMTYIGQNLAPHNENKDGMTWFHPDRRPWSGNLTKEPKVITVFGQSSRITTNVARQHILTRSPNDGGMLLGLPEMIDVDGVGDGGFGYGLYYLSYPYGSKSQLPPIAPKNPDKKNFILHPTAIDFGEGPVLIYWYDVNVADQTMQVRGRLITTGNSYTADFRISDVFPLPSSDMWFGDYHTAGGARKTGRAVASAINTTVSAQRPRASTSTFEFVPAWKQSDGNAYFAKVTYTSPASNTGAGHDRFTIEANSKLVTGPIDFSTIEDERVEQER